MVKGYCSDVSMGTNEATINGQTFGINTNVVKIDYVKVGNCEYGIDKSNGLIKFFKHTKEDTQVPVTPTSSYSKPISSEKTKHKVLTEMDGDSFERELNRLSMELNVFATQTHIKEGLWSGVVFYK